MIFKKILSLFEANKEKIFLNLISIVINVKMNLIKKRIIIFICGMPRSGTTLTEQIIAAHQGCIWGRRT